jgi:hypothetical protein
MAPLPSLLDPSRRLRALTGQQENQNYSSLHLVYELTAASVALYKDAALKEPIAEVPLLMK